MSRLVAITTVDNPYDPFEEFSEWFRWDELNGYHTSGLLARLAFTSEDFSDSMNENILESTIDDIVETFGSDTYRKLVIET